MNKDHTDFIWRTSVSRSVELSNRFAALEDLNAEVEINSA
jgi:hypothetical protein